MNNSQGILFEPLKSHEMAGRLMNKKAIQDFIFAGSAVFTIRNNNTGKRFTFKIRADGNNVGKWWVDNLRGPGVFSSIGVILGNSKGYHLPWEYKRLLDASVALHHSKMKKIPRDKQTSFDATTWNKENLPLSVRSFMWFLTVYKSGNEFPNNIEIWHEGVCGRCGKQLTAPDSIEAGFGRECLKWVEREDRQEGLRL